eukprot:maker-scaffold_20-snap-gene-5.4-mRNA-1 protein AED:0.00 eAED:0.00 QI:54/1/1/1/1/1/3/618/259
MLLRQEYEANGNTFWTIMINNRLLLVLVVGCLFLALFSFCFACELWREFQHFKVSIFQLIKESEKHEGTNHRTKESKVRSMPSILKIGTEENYRENPGKYYNDYSKQPNAKLSKIYQRRSVRRSQSKNILEETYANPMKKTLGTMHEDDKTENFEFLKEKIIESRRNQLDKSRVHRIKPNEEGFEISTDTLFRSAHVGNSRDQLPELQSSNELSSETPVGKFLRGSRRISFLESKTKDFEDDSESIQTEGGPKKFHDFF